MKTAWVFACLTLFCLVVSPAHAQQRAPATPLITHDPYFSIWSTTDRLTDSDTTHWTGSPQPICGIARIDGKPYRFMGREPEDRSGNAANGQLDPAYAYSLRVSTKRRNAELAFFTPAMMNDLDLLSRPVTYLTWSVPGYGWSCASGLGSCWMSIR
jgi:hypothetical protein